MHEIFKSLLNTVDKVCRTGKKNQKGKKLRFWYENVVSG